MTALRFPWWALTMLCLVLTALPVAAAGLPRKGDVLPLFELASPESEPARDYLGIAAPTFKLGDVACRVLVLEVIGVYCPQCYRQAPLFNTLHSRIEKGKLKGQVKLLAVAAGGNANEIRYLNDQIQYAFPVVPDPKFEFHKLVGEPRTPFILLIGPNGKVLYTHMGVVEDIEPFLKVITDLAR